MAAQKTVLSQTMAINASADELVKAGAALGSLMENEVVNIVVTEKAEVAEAE